MNVFLRKFAVMAFAPVAVSVMLLASGCAAGLQQEVDDLKKRVTEIEAVVSALEAKHLEGLMVEEVTPLDPPAQGWLVTFSDGSQIEIANGGVEVRVEEDGSVTFIIDGEEFTFGRGSDLRSIEVMTDVVAFDGAQTVEVLVRVNPSTASIPTGTGEAIAMWTLDQVGTRASYLNPAAAFAIESIEPDGEKTGQYVATISGNPFEHDPEVTEYSMALVLDENGEEADGLISSGMFTVTQSGHILGEVVYDAQIYMADYYKNGSSNFQLRLNSLDWSTMDTPGYTFTLSFNSPLVDDNFDVSHIRIPNGTYRFDGGTDEWQIYQGDIAELTPEGDDNWYFVYDGSVLDTSTMTIEGEGSYYKISFNVKTRGGKTIVAKYEGEIGISNPFYWPHKNNIDTGFVHSGPVATWTETGYFGDLYGGGGDSFRFFLVDFDTEDPQWDGDGWQLHVDFYTAPVDKGVYSSGLDIPAGTYPINDTKAPGTVVLGGGTNIVEVVNKKGGVSAPISGGNVVVSGSGENYSMTFDIELENNTRFTATYEGALAIANPFGLPAEDESVAEPTALAVESVRPIGATLSWDKGDADGWAFRIQGDLTEESEGLDGEYVEFWPEASTPGFVLDGLLLPDNTYTWQVANITDGKRSAWVSGPDITTAPAGDGGDMGTLSGLAKWTYNPNFYGDGSVDAWVIQAFQSPGVTVDGTTPTGTGWLLETVFHGPLNAGQGMIPNRTYPINDTYGMFTVLSGSEAGGTTLSYIENGALTRSLPIVSGSVVATIPRGVYTFVFEAMTAYGDNVTFTLEIDSSTNSPTVVPAP
ncbi:MAG: DUF4988 domain-containing protein [Alistipes sp.]|jgi:hypothetical protein|nr:DUF4988 domain-containing protein [Alistipes sp.]